MLSELGSSKGRARQSKHPCAHSTPRYISGRIGRNFHPCKNIVLCKLLYIIKQPDRHQSRDCQLRLPNVL
jgi:hypothetical protein